MYLAKDFEDSTGKSLPSSPPTSPKQHSQDISLDSRGVELTANHVEELPTSDLSSETLKHETWWSINKGLVLIMFSELVSAAMITIAKLLLRDIPSGNPNNEKPMNLVQILFLRMVGTTILSFLYMWWTKVPDFPLGQSSVRWLLILRGALGFGAVTNFYCVYASHISILDFPDMAHSPQGDNVLTILHTDAASILSQAEVTAIGFLIPLFCSIAFILFLHEAISRRTIIASCICLLGVFIIAFSRPPEVPLDPNPKSTQQRVIAAICTIFDDIFAASVYIIIRIIGDRAHSLISVNYYSIISLTISFFIILFSPSMEFMLPTSPRQWLLLILLALSGFLLQLLVTAGLRADKTGKGTLMYSQIIFALVLERLV